MAGGTSPEAGHGRARGDSSKALAPRSGLLKLSRNGSLGSGVQRLPGAKFSLPLTLWAFQGSRTSQRKLRCLHAHLRHIQTVFTAGKGQLRWSEWCRKQEEDMLMIARMLLDVCLPLSSAGETHLGILQALKHGIS